MNNQAKFKFRNSINIVRLITSLITIVSLTIGFSSIRFAFDAKWEYAVYSIIIAAILDAVDGRVARYLNATSTFGAELDSLCDFANFGIAPALLIYFWTFKDYSIKLFSWASVLFYIVCMVLRLARFNTYVVREENNVKISKKYFQGVPAPAGAILVMLPLVLDIEISENIGFSFRKYTDLIIIYQFLISILVISSLPTFSLKSINITHNNLRFFIVIFVVFVIGIYLFTWYMIPLISLIYLCSIIFTVKEFYSQKID